MGYECITDVRTVSMVYNLDSNQIPFRAWMIYDIAQNVENAIVTTGLNEVSFCFLPFVSFRLLMKRHAH